MTPAPSTERRPTSEELKSLLDAATQGEWEVVHYRRDPYNHYAISVDVDGVDTDLARHMSFQDASLMVLSRQLATELLEVREENEGLRKALNGPSWTPCPMADLLDHLATGEAPNDLESGALREFAGMLRSALSAVAPGEGELPQT
jgi:hypothetical protein